MDLNRIGLILRVLVYPLPELCTVYLRQPSIVASSSLHFRDVAATEDGWFLVAEAVHHRYSSNRRLREQIAEARREKEATGPVQAECHGL